MLIFVRVTKKKEGSCLMNGVKSPEIDIAAIHDVDGPGLWRDEIESQGIAHFTVGNMDKTRYRSAQIKQCVHFDRAFGGTKLAYPVKTYTRYILGASSGRNKARHRSAPLHHRRC